MNDDFELEPWGKIFKDLCIGALKKIGFIARYILLILGCFLFIFIFSGVFVFFNASENIVFLSVIVSFFLYLIIYGFISYKITKTMKYNKDLNTNTTKK